ncbi:MAG: HlyD family secretion protein [Isosphaeraceae bacterium]
MSDLSSPAPGEQMPDSVSVQVIQAEPRGVTLVSSPYSPTPGRPRRASLTRTIRLAVLAPYRLIGRVLRSFRFWLLVVLVVLVVLVAYYVIADRDTPLTTDAYVQAYVVRVAPQVSGLVVRVHVGEGSTVRTGDVLFELDHRPFQHQVEMLEAKLVTTRREVKQLYTQLAAEEAEHRRLTAEDELAKYLYERDNRIYQGGATTERKFTSSAQSYKASRAAVDKSARMIQHIQEAIDAQVGQENSLVARVEAELAGARLNLEYSTVQAPCDGVTTNLQLREGDFAHVGEAVLSCVDRGRWLVVANYRERSLERLRPGQRALVTFRAAPGRIYGARVFALGWGVSTTPGLPVQRPYTWAMNAPAVSCRTVMNCGPPSANASRIGEIAPPGMPKTKGTPWASRLRTRSCAPDRAEFDSVIASSPLWAASASPASVSSADSVVATSLHQRAECLGVSSGHPQRSMLMIRCGSTPRRKITER